MIARFRSPEGTAPRWLIAARIAISVCTVGPACLGFAMPSVAGVSDDGRADTSDVRLAAKSSRLVAVVRGFKGVFIFPALPQRLAPGIDAKNLPATPELAKLMLSADGKVLAGVRVAESGGFELVLVDVATGVVTANRSLPEGTAPDAVWVDAEGKSAGAWIGERLLVYGLEGRDGLAGTERVERVTSAFVASPSGRMVVWVDDAGHLHVVDTRSWRDLASVSAGVDRAVAADRNARAKSTAVAGTGGPFVFPIVPIDISADDRVLTVSLGESASTLLNICLADGTIRSSASLDKRVTVRSMLSKSGRLFAVQTTPNSDDPAFARPTSFFGLRILETLTGTLVATIPIPNEDWLRYRSSGASYFLDKWAGWIGFMPDESAVLRFDRASGTVTRDGIKGGIAKTLRPTVPCDAPLGL